MSRTEMFPNVVRDHAHRHPDREALVFLHDTGSALRPESLTYGELDRRIRKVAARLQQEGDPNRPVLLLYPSTLDFAIAFLACFYVGRTAIPAPLPTEQGERLSRVNGILRDSSADVILTDSRHDQAITGWLAQSGASSVGCFATDREDIGDADAWRPTDVTPDALAFLQYTSGSTSAPKGTMITHGNLAANEEAIRKAVGTWPGVTIGGWLPLYHDMGLIGQFMHPLWMGGTGVLMSPTTFLKRPHRWLRMIHDYRIDISQAPNFAYEQCVRRVTDEQAEGLDLSCLAHVLNGAEPVRVDTLRAFADRFAPYGLRPEALSPCYGMAEATLLVTNRVPGQRYVERTVDVELLEGDVLHEPRPGHASRTIPSCGVPQDVELLIVDPRTREVLPDGQVGEIWLRGPSVAVGYWNQPDLTEETFRAATADGREGFLRTGDKGALDDGQLYVTGRIKEILIHNGRNLYPQDIEGAVQEAGAPYRAGGGAVFGVQDPDADVNHVLVVQELRPTPGSPQELAALAAQVQNVLSRRFQLPRASVVLVRPGTVRKTTSGKIQRLLMRRLFLAGELPAVHTRLDPRVEAMIAGGPEAPAQDGTAVAEPALS